MFCVQYTAYIKQRRTEACGGAGNSLFLGISERAGSIGTSRCAELLVTLRVRIVRNLSAEYLPPTQQQRYTPDVDQRKSPERTIGRRTSSSTHACQTPHCGKTPRRPAPTCPPAQRPHVSASLQGGLDQRTPPTRGARHSLPARMQLSRLPSHTHAAPANPAHKNGPNTPAPHMHPVGPRKQGFLHMAGAQLWQ
jgi:hypothetical protein